MTTDEDGVAAMLSDGSIEEHKFIATPKPGKYRHNGRLMRAPRVSLVKSASRYPATCFQGQDRPFVDVAHLEQYPKAKTHNRLKS